MDRTAQYYIRKINESIANNNKTDAEMYYKKAIANIGEISEILDLKPKINTLQEPNVAEPPKTVDNLETRKIKKNNETKITIIAICVAVVALIAYLCIAVFPKHNLDNKIGHEWYQGDVSSYNSDGIMLEFKSRNNYDFEIIYKQYEGMPIAEFECQVLNGHQISVDGQTINVRFEDDGEKIIFSPSFVDLSEESVWKKYSSFGGNEPFIPPTAAQPDKTVSSSKENVEPTKKDCSSGHSWQDITETIHHKEEGHYENVEVDFKSVEKYHCSSSDCENTPWYYSYDELSRHYQNVHGYTVSRDQMISMCYTSYDQKPVYEKKWIVDKEAYDETVVKGQKCSVCGETK